MSLRKIELESSSTGSSFPADSAKPVPLAVVPLQTIQFPPSVELEIVWDGYRVWVWDWDTEVAEPAVISLLKKRVPVTLSNYRNETHSNEIF